MGMPEFQVGDRVRLRARIEIVPAGAIGTVLRVFSTISDMYEVQFEGFLRPYLVYGRDLQALDDAPPPP